MLYHSSIIKNYQDFEEKFGKIKYGNGKIGRKNKILLQLLKDKEFFKSSIKTGYHEYIYQCSNIMELREYLFSCIGTTNQECFIRGNSIRIPFLKRTFFSKEYKFDDYNGVCLDGIPGYVRIVKPDGKIVKVRSGKFFMSLINDSNFNDLPDYIKTWFCEELCYEWKAFTSDVSYILHVSNEPEAFTRIYSSDNSLGDFHSCMTDKGFENFYYQAVEDVSAAWLENKSGEMVARCVIFNNCINSSGDKYRLAERQYSTNGNSLLKRVLINKLIEENYIDGYKVTDAGCHDTTAFVNSDGSPIDHCNFYIKCDINKSERTVSYQDSFKFYNDIDKIAYNTERNDANYDLSVTEGFVEDESSVWSEYEGCYIDEMEAIWIEYIADYVFECNARYSQSLGEYILNEDSVYCVDLDSWQLTDNCILLDSGESVYDYESVSTCPICGHTFFRSQDGIHCGNCITKLNYDKQNAS